jgi:hypothetical protein
MKSSAAVRLDIDHSVEFASRALRSGAFACSQRTRQRRRELVWAWLSVLVLVLCWDAAARLDQKVSPPRPRLTHVAEADDKTTQKALIPVSARPTVSW